ncbi:hypothetical protein JCM11491_001686 [Sporobolomyces phaffii]
MTTRTDPDAIPDEPPPAYEPTPSVHANEHTLEYGPVRPFQPPPGAPPPRPPSHPDLPERRPSRNHRYQPAHLPQPEPDRPYRPPPNAAPLPPPTFPFWNGPSLTPAQTGFHEGPSLAPFGARLQPPPPPAPPTPAAYEPTTTPTPGQPLLHHDQLLVYPVGRDPCWKCSNTGYKPFDDSASSRGGGYQGDDPSHPCRKCWKNFGKPYTAVLRHSHHPAAPPNYQKPLRLFATPASGPGPVAPHFAAAAGAPRPPVIFTNQRPHVNVLGNSLVVRPGDPRIGGVLCRTCDGDGLMMGPFIFDEVTCTRCLGTGRVF